jgi:hypothetical protein
MPWIVVIPNVISVEIHARHTKTNSQQQEKRLFQDLERTTDTHSNGLTTKDQDE